MIILKESHLQNVVTYESARLPLDRKGVTLIYGRNLDSSVDPLKSNGAGKSLLITTMAETLLDQHPLLEGRHVAKDSYQEDTKSSVTFDDYRLEKSLVGKTLKYTLEKNVSGKWKPTKIRTTEYIWGKMAQLFPITNVEFFTLSYIDSSRPSLLQRGTHANRLSLFSSLLRLDKYDTILGEIKAKTKTLKASDIKLGEVLDNIALQKTSIPKNLKAETSKLKDLTEKQRKLALKRSELSALIQSVVVYDSHIKPLKELKDFASNHSEIDSEGIDWADPDTLINVTGVLTSEVKRIKTDLKTTRDNEADLVRARDKTARLKALNKLLAESPSDSVKELKSLIKATKVQEDDKHELDTSLARAKKVVSKLDDPDAKHMKTLATRLKKDLDIKEEDAGALLLKVVQALAVAKSNYNDQETAIKEFNELLVGNEECPTCKSSMTPKTIKLLGDKITDDLLVASVLVSDLEDSLAMAKELGQLQKAANKYKEALDEVDTLSAQSAEEPDFDSDVLGEYLQLLVEKLEIQDFLDNFKKVGVPKQSSEELTDELAYCSSLLEKAQGLKRYFVSLNKAIEINAGDYNKDDLEETQLRLDGVLAGINKEIPSLSHVVSIANSAKEKLATLCARRDNLEVELNDLPVLKALEEAYGQRGLKNVDIQRACMRLQSNLNVYAGLLFSEHIKFTVDADETHLNIIATRDFNGRSISTDVRRFSGAESAAFNLLAPMAILPLIPDSRRTNIMVLDEPTSHMDEPAITLFTDKFLPKLLEMVPHVIILNPNRLDVDHDTLEEWVVTRKDGVSTLAKL